MGGSRDWEMSNLWGPELPPYVPSTSQSHLRVPPNPVRVSTLGQGFPWVRNQRCTKMTQTVASNVRLCGGVALAGFAWWVRSKAPHTAVQPQDGSGKRPLTALGIYAAQEDT